MTAMLRVALLLTVALIGCRHRGESDTTDVETYGDADTDTDSDSDTDTDTDLGAPYATTDVLVIGSGPAGLSAAYAAAEAGKDVLILERAEYPGGSGWFAGRFYAVDTKYMRDQGIVDSVDLAAGEWPVWSMGGDPDDPRVQLLLERSGETVEWIGDTLGVPIERVTNELGTPGLPRMHEIPGEGDGPTAALVAQFTDRILLSHEATDIVFDPGGRAVGASFREMTTGTEGWVEAGSVVVATGGFARDLDRVLEHRTDLAATDLLIEIAYTSDGGGIGLMERAGAVWQNHGAYGVYVHAMEDHREGYEQEALWPGGLQHSVLLDKNGRRFTNEEKAFGFELAGILGALPEKRVFAVLPQSIWYASQIVVPAYQSQRGSALSIAPEQLVTEGVVGEYATLADLAMAWGMDVATVEATFAEYETYVAAGDDAAYDKPRDALRPFEDGPYITFELKPGAAKAFTGFAVDVDGRVVDSAGEVVPGLYAAGEVTGMLGSPGAGGGFSGSITACYLTGIVAGEQSAAYVGD
jgi:fumarate reductase flavoprotein subunit